MNIDMVNAAVVNNSDYNKKVVELVNSYYWGRVKEHIMSYDPNPVNIDYVCVLYANKHYIKKEILSLIDRIRKLRVNKNFKEDSIKKQAIEEGYKKHIRGLLKIRKHYKYTN